MGEEELFLSDFAISYWTTYEKQKIDVIRTCKEYINSIHLKGIIMVEVEDYSKYLKDLAKERVKNNIPLYFKIWDVYLDLICLTASLQGKKIYIRDFTESFNKPFKIKKFWYSIGTIDNNIDEIIERTNKVLDLAHDKKGSKNCIPMLMEITN